LRLPCWSMACPLCAHGHRHEHGCAPFCTHAMLCSIGMIRCRFSCNRYCSGITGKRAANAASPF